MSFRLAMAQILVEGAQPLANLNRAVTAIRCAAESDCRIVVLPECLDLGWTDPSARSLAEPIPGPFSDRLCEAARQNKIFVVAGLVERDHERRFNSAVLIDMCGSIRLVHRKINELDIALDLYSTGDRMGVVETEIGTIGISICADNFSDSFAIGEVLARMGAQLLLSPSAWAVDADHNQQETPYGDLWRGSYARLCRDYGLTVVGVSSVGELTHGPWQGHKVIGCSLAMGPDGNLLAEGPYGPEAEALIIADIDLKPPKGRGTAFGNSLHH